MCVRWSTLPRRAPPAAIKRAAAGQGMALCAWCLHRPKGAGRAKQSTMTSHPDIKLGRAGAGGFIWIYKYVAGLNHTFVMTVSFVPRAVRGCSERTVLLFRLRSSRGEGRAD